MRTTMARMSRREAANRIERALARSAGGVTGHEIRVMGGLTQNQFAYGWRRVLRQQENDVQFLIVGHGPHARYYRRDDPELAMMDRQQVQKGNLTRLKTEEMLVLESIRMHRRTGIQVPIMLEKEAMSMRMAVVALETANL